MHNHEGKILKGFLKSENITQQEIADKMGISRNTIVNYLQLSELPIEFKKNIRGTNRGIKVQ